MNTSKIEATFSSNKILKCFTAYNKYGGYCVPVSSQQRPAVQIVLRGSVYEPDTIKYITENCEGGDVVHAGTYFGDFLPGISMGMSEGAKIWAFEPNYENYRCAQITLLINNLENIILKNAGLGSSKSVRNLLIQNEKGYYLGGASRIVETEEMGKTVKINLVSIDETITKDRNVSIIHLDVEGYEKEALKGALNTIKRCKPILILEDNNNILKTDWFNDNIISLGYKKTGNVHHNRILKL